MVDDHVEAWLAGPPQDGDLGLAVDIVLQVAAAGVGRALARRRHAEELPIQSGDEVLTEIISGPPEIRSDVVQRARTLGLPIDGWHVAVRVEVEELADGAPAAAATRGHQVRRAVGRATLRALRAGGGEWHIARAGAAIVLIRMYAEDPGARAAGQVVPAVDEAMGRVRARLPTTVLRCGVGSPHPGGSGLRASVAEARAATSAARSAGRMNSAVPFDAVGLRRTLLEWYASDSAQEAVTTVLEPLTRLGGARAERLIQTLHVYLDHRGSLTKTAETLNLHRNAVGYRIRQIFAELDVDQDNPDDLLLLQLACRARELG
jgi:sugar diacid utilization regulator